MTLKQLKELIDKSSSSDELLCFDCYAELLDLHQKGKHAEEFEMCEKCREKKDSQGKRKL